MAKLAIREWLSRWEEDRRFMENVRAMKQFPPFECRFMPFPEWTPPRLRAIIEKRDLRHLYSHQAEAVNLIRNGRDVVLVTPTASGKTLCYNLPVLNSILENRKHGPSIYFRRRPSPKIRCMKFTAWLAT